MDGGYHTTLTRRDPPATRMNPPTLDTHEFTRRGDTASGTVPLAGLARLGSLLLEGSGELSWRLSGHGELGPDGSRRSFMRLALQARPTMRCVRCLEPIVVDVEALRDYRMVSSEAQAEREDAEDDEHDLLVSSRQFDLPGLIEDEAIMALPLAPRHADCHAPAVQEGTDDNTSVPEPSGPGAFAALGALRRGGGAAGGSEGGR
jgi:uncharacterized protein